MIKQEQEMVQLSARLPPLWAPRARIPELTPYVGLVCQFVLALAQRGFSPGTPVFPSPQKSTFPNVNSTRNGR